MNGTMPPRDRGYRRPASGGTPGDKRTLPGARGLVGGIKDVGETTKKAAERKPGGGRKAASCASALDGVATRFADFLAGDDQPVVFRQRAAGAQHRPGGVLLPFHF